MPKRQLPPRHLYQADPGMTDRRGGVDGCAHCPLPKAHSVHDVPAVSADAALIDARRLGEAARIPASERKPA